MAVICEIRRLHALGRLVELLETTNFHQMVDLFGKMVIVTGRYALFITVPPVEYR